MSMFWGLVMKPNRKYTQTIVKSFHISGVALDKGEEAKLYLTADKQKYVVATVRKDNPQVPLDLNFSKGDQIIFQTTGDATVSLLGYLHDMDSEDEDDAFDLKTLLKQKGKAGKNEQEEDEDDDEEDDDEELDDSQIIEEYESLLENGDEEDDEEDDDDDDEEGDESGEEQDSDDSDEEDEQPKAKVAKIAPKANEKAGKDQNGVAKNQQEKQAKKEKPEPKKEQPKPKEQDKKAAGGERTITGGVKIVDLAAGKGPEAQKGKRATVYYIGRLQSNNKTFDSMLNGKGFRFRLGGGEVIKGWDTGVIGMKVGGKRRITCPPHMAYGARGAPPNIPPNSTLVFEVELKGVN